MPSGPYRPLTFCALAALLSLAGTTSTLAQAGQPVGVAATAVRRVTGDAGGVVRHITVGAGVFQDETVATGERSNTQLLFRDETTLTIGPSSAVVLDRFVYNPAGTADRFAVELGRGALRFVSGSSRSQNYEIRTQIATIGVRGTIIDVFARPRYTLAILSEGAERACFGARCVDVVKPGTYAIVYANGRVEGPKPWDGALRQIVGPISFPLYGWHLDLDRRPRYQYDERRDDIDQFERERQQREPIPPHEPIPPGLN